MSGIMFNFCGKMDFIECKEEDQIRDIFEKYAKKANRDINSFIFLHNGKTLAEDSYFVKYGNYPHKQINKIIIEVLDKEAYLKSENEGIIKSRDIICPQCHESCMFKINDFQIKLFGCKNGHINDNILLEEFEKTQYINEKKILCNNCNNNKFNSQFRKIYRCIPCNKNLCSSCKSNHDSSHPTVDYEKKNFFCLLHNCILNSYCYDCKINLCGFCKKEHNNHQIVNYKEIFEQKNVVKENLKEFRKDLGKFIDEIKEKIDTLNYMIKTINLFFEINNNILKNNSLTENNYEMFNNIKEVRNNMKIKDIYEILNEENIQLKRNKFLNLYNKIKSIKIKNYNKKEYELSEYFKIENNDKNILKIKLKGINNITDMQAMFLNCPLLLSLPDIDNWDTSKITNMSSVFNQTNEHSVLKTLPDISKWNTSNVTDMSYMFQSCRLSNLPDISKWDTSNVTKMNFMFADCSLTNLPDISKWNTSKVTDMSFMFFDCSSLKYLPDLSKWNTSNVINMGNMFSNCSSLITLPDLSKWDTSNVVDMFSMFENCSLLLHLPDISKWNTSKLYQLNKMFKNCSSLTTLPDISKWNLKSYAKLGEMFDGCSTIINIPSKFL